MEPITLFAVSVGLVGVCKLTFSAADFFGRGIYHKGRRTATRDNWYCYFKTSDLWGRPKRRDELRPDLPPAQRRQSYQRRPRA